MMALLALLMALPVPAIGSGLRMAQSAQQETQQQKKPQGGESEDPVLLQRLGILYIQENQPKQAIRTLLRATDYLPENGETHMWLGFAYFLNRQFDEAEESYLRAIAHNPDLTEVHNYLGLLRVEQGEPEQAINEFELALEDPTFPPVSRLRVLLNLGKLYFEQGDPESAMKPLQEAVELATNPTEPAYSLVYLLVGKTLRQTGRLEEAVAALSKVLEVEESNVDAHLVIGLAYRDMGNIDKARNHLQQVLRLAPGSAMSERAQAALAQLH